MKFSINDLVYFIGFRELQKEQLQQEVQKLTGTVEAYKKELSKLTKEQTDLVEKKLLG